MTPESRPALPALAIQFIINGDGATIHCNTQAAASEEASGAPALPGQDATIAQAREQSTGKGWGTRLRKRDMVVAIATIVGAIAVVIGTAIAICSWAGWAP